LFTENNDLQTVFSNPAITHINKEKVLDGLIAKTNPSKTTANFLKVLLQNGRLADLGEINDRFATVLEERSGIVSAEITSARDLPVGERAEFEKNLEKITGKKVIINYAINKEIIGGVITRIGSTVYDGSVKTKLENLKEQLVNG
ncbi:MAG: ATP synthase F1 subunit delta, partial [Pyrinomonadaceae bacterium]